MSLTDQPGTVVTTDGVEGTFVILSPQAGQTEPMLRLTFPNVKPILVPTSLLVHRGSGAFRLPLDSSQLDDAKNIAAIIPIVSEALRIHKDQVDTGGVRVTKRVLNETQIVDEPLSRQEIQIEHVAKNEYVDTAAGIRLEGDATIIPLYEEVLVVEKRLLLKEELVIHKRKVEFHAPQEVTLRREEAIVEQVEHASSSTNGDTPLQPPVTAIKAPAVAKTKRQRTSPKGVNR